MISLIFWLLAAISYSLVRSLDSPGLTRFRNVKTFSFFGYNAWGRKFRDNNPSAGPKFWGSTTIFVFVTSGEELFKWLTFWFLAGAVISFDIPFDSVEYIVGALIAYRLSWWFVFNLFYKYILKT